MGKGDSNLFKWWVTPFSKGRWYRNSKSTLTKFKNLRSSPKPKSPFQPNLAQRILGWRGWKFFQIKGHTLFCCFENNEITKIHWRSLITFFSRTDGSISSTLGTKHPRMKRIHVLKKNMSLNQRYGIISIIALPKCVYWLELCLRWSMWPICLLFNDF